MPDPADSMHPPITAYRGAETFVFVSYAHRDKAKVFPEILRLSELGVRIWYDEGIMPGSADWADEITSALERAAVLIFFVTPNSVVSRECKNEFTLAYDVGKTIVCIHLEETKLTGVYKLQANRMQAILKYKMTPTHYDWELQKTISFFSLGLPPAGATTPPLESPPKAQGKTAEKETPSRNRQPKRPQDIFADKERSSRSRFPVGALLCVGAVVAIAVVYFAWMRETPGTGNPAEATPAPTVTTAPREPGERKSDPVMPAPVVTPLSAPSPAAVASKGPASNFKAPPKASPNAREIAPPLTASKTAPYKNSLGMEFIPVPIGDGPTAGHWILFSIWETRVQDYAPFAKERGLPWPPAKFAQSSHPAVNVSWAEATKYCEWLTSREQAAGTLPHGCSYRLPHDHEWSCAAGLREDPALTPLEKNGKLPGIFLWGSQQQPPPLSGNFADESARAKHTAPTTLGKYDDGYAETAPVGSFAVSASGLFDLEGNASEWCEDWYNPEQTYRVLRGASWHDGVERLLWTSARFYDAPTNRHEYYGFRVILDCGPGAHP